MLVQKMAIIAMQSEIELADFQQSHYRILLDHFIKLSDTAKKEDCMVVWLDMVSVVRVRLAKARTREEDAKMRLGLAEAEEWESEN